LRVGITYDLRTDYIEDNLTEEELAEFDRPDTVQSIELALEEVGFETDRVGNLKRLAGRLAEGHRWDLVFNIAEGLYGYGRESAVPALLDSCRIPYTFSDPMTTGLTLMTRPMFLMWSQTQHTILRSLRLRFQTLLKQMTTSLGLK